MSTADTPTLADLGRKKTVAGAIAIAGFMLVLWGAHSLLGWPGAAIALGLPMVGWGFWSALLITESEVMLSEIGRK